MRKLKYILLSLLFLFTLTACDYKKEKQEAPLFIEVSKEGSNNKIYLLGSIHAADESVYPLSNKIMKAYKKSDYLAVEFDIIAYVQNIGKQMETMQKFVYTENKTIKDDIDEETYNKMVNILKDVKLYTPLYNNYKPIIWESLIETATATKSGLDEEYGIDLHFLTKAKEDNKNILELESADFQYDMLLNLKDEISIYLLKEAVNNFDKSVTDLKETYEAYKRGNRDELESLIFTEEDEENELLEEYNELLIDKRNKGMYEKLVENFENDKTIFCVVGLAHIIGENGLANMFEANGYKVIIK